MHHATAAYFTPQNRDARVRAWTDALATLRGVTRPCSFARPVLVAIDLQRLFLDTASPLCLPAWRGASIGAGRLLDFFVRARLPILFTRHAHTAADLPHLLGHFFDRLLMEGDPLADLDPWTRPWRDHAPIHVKAQHAAFGNGLPALLKNADPLVLLGVQTPLCVTATALDLARYGVIPVVVSDACAAQDEAGHLAALRVLASGHAHVRTSDELIRALTAFDPGGTP